MKKHIFIMIRYSVFSENSSAAWVIGRKKTTKEYKSDLFSDERMSLHENLFFQVTLPSLQKMSPEKTSVLLFTSEDLPKKYMAALLEVQRESSNLEVIPLSSHGSVVDKMQERLREKLETFDDEVCYATVRLDDDDALSDDFEDFLFEYVDPTLCGHVITFPNGYEGIYENGVYTHFIPLSRPKVAMGMSFVQLYKPGQSQGVVSVYSLGNHMRVDEKYPVVMNPAKGMYVRTVHQESDFFASQYDEKLKQTHPAQSVGYYEISKRFFFLKNLCVDSLKKLPCLNIFKHPVPECCLVTHHKSFLYYSHIDGVVRHSKPENVDIEKDIDWVVFDKRSMALRLSNSGFFLNFDCDLGVDISSSDSRLFLTPNGKGVAVIVGGNKELYLSAQRNGEVGLKNACKSWEVFHLN